MAFVTAPTEDVMTDLQEQVPQLGAVRERKRTGAHLTNALQQMAMVAMGVPMPGAPVPINKQRAIPFWAGVARHTLMSGKGSPRHMSNVMQTAVQMPQSIYRRMAPTRLFDPNLPEGWGGVVRSKGDRGTALPHRMPQAGVSLPKDWQQVVRMSTSAPKDAPPTYGRDLTVHEMAGHVPWQVVDEVDYPMASAMHQVDQGLWRRLIHQLTPRIAKARGKDEDTIRGMLTNDIHDALANEKIAAATERYGPPPKTPDRLAQWTRLIRMEQTNAVFNSLVEFEKILDSVPVKQVLSADELREWREIHNDGMARFMMLVDLEKQRGRFD